MARAPAIPVPAQRRAVPATDVLALEALLARAQLRSGRAKARRDGPYIQITSLQGLYVGVLAILVCLLASYAIEGRALIEPSTLAKADRETGRMPAAVKSDRLLDAMARDARDEISGDSPLAFAQRFGESFADRFDAIAATHVSRGTAEKMSTPAAPIRVAALPREEPLEVLGLRQQAKTDLIGFRSSAFPYFGRNPRTQEAFLNVSDGGRKGRRSYSGRVYWHDETYHDNRVLVHIPKHFDADKPGVIVVFFHGNGATLSRDVRDRQRVPQQISDSGANAVLLAPQLAVDAADSSAGKFWEPGALKRFMAESADHLARLYGNPKAAKAFASMPIVIVAYSGGYVPAAWALHVGGVEGRVRGVILLDALYGELDKFESWIAKNRSAFFVSAYTRYTKRRDDQLVHILNQRGIDTTGSLSGAIKPGTVAFIATGDGITHRDYVTRAWIRDPIKDVLMKMPSAGRQRI